METIVALIDRFKNPLSENQCGMETTWSHDRMRFPAPVEREPMWDGNESAEPMVTPGIVEREPMWDGN